MLDAIIRNSTLFGLEGDESRKIDLGIKDGLIAKIGNMEEEAERVIDAGGRYTMPGFVDVHSHSDYYLLIDPRAESKVMQGVTTEIGGNCGYSSNPIGGEIQKIRGETFKEQYGLDLDWHDFSQYFKRLEKGGTSVNFAGLIGYNTLRASILGLSDIEMQNGVREKMEKTIKDNLDQGAAGMSVGLVYPPACFASMDEVAGMVSHVKKADKIFTTHIRSEGAQLEESIEEVIEIARRTGVKLQISHLKTAGKENWQKLDSIIETIEKARAQGLDIGCDRYPYTASNTGLQVLLPDWAFDGGRDAVLERLADRSTRKKLTEEILKNHPEPGYWESVMIAQVVSNKNLHTQGKTVAQAADEAGKNVFDFILDLLLEEKTEVEAIYFCMNESNMDRIIVKDYVIIGSDSGARTLSGPLGDGHPHPRTFGTFPRFFRDYVFDRKLIPMREAVRKTSTAACERYGIKKRGRLMEGFHADIVVMDPKKVADRSTYEKPLSYPAGIEYLFVNGVLTLDSGKHTGVTAGRGLEIH
jgi:N-acyl-D-amino-acid deacylase